MKAGVYLIVLLVMGWLTGLYQLDILMVVWLTGIFFFGLMVLISFSLKKGVLAELEIIPDIVYRNTPVSGRVQVVNQSFFPLIQFRVWMKWENQLTGEKGKQLFRSSCPAKSKTELTFELMEKSCGIVKVSLNRIDLYDFLGLIKQKKKMQETQIFSVFPSGGEMNGEIWDRGMGERKREDRFIKLTDTPSDAEEIRPYMQGDFLKNVHWKLSARTEELLSRRYHAEGTNKAVIYLELRRWMESEVSQVHAFLELTARVAQTLLQENWELCFFWEQYKSSEQQEWAVQHDKEYDYAMEALLEELGSRRQKQFCLDESQIEERKTEEELQIQIDFYANLLINGQWIERFTEPEESSSAFGETE